MNKPPLRPYQQDAVDILTPLIGKEKKLYLSMPFGTGRAFTIVAALYAYYQATSKTNSCRTLFVVNNVVQINDLEGIISNIFGDDFIETLNTWQKERSIKIATLQSIIRNNIYEKIDESAFDIIVFIDCERGSLSSLINVINYFQTSTTIGVGYYNDMISPMFGVATFHYSIKDAIHSKIFRSFNVQPVEIDLPKEYLDIDAKFKYLLSSGYYLDIICDTILENIKDDKKTVIICKSTSYAKQLSITLNQKKQNEEFSNVISSRITEQEREYIIQSFNHGKLSVLVGVDAVLYGTNLRSIDNLIILRRFESENLILRSISKYLMIHGNTAPLNILDFVGNKWSLTTETILSEGQTGNITVNKTNENKFKKTVLFSKTELKFATKNRLQGVIGVNEIAEELADTIVNMPCEAGCMVGIFGKWGRGKTFLMNETWKVIKNSNEKKEGRNFKRIDFHAWKYQDTPAIWAYLYEKFAEAYYNCDKDEKQQSGWFARNISYPWNRLWRIFKLNIVRTGWWTNLFYFILLFAGAFGILCIIFLTLPVKVDIISKLMASLGLSIISFWAIFFRYKNPAMQLFKRYYSRPSFVKILGVQEEVQKELKHLVKAWGQKVKNVKFLLFVDDIDRCTEEKIIQLIDALRVMLDDDLLSQNIVIVAAIDERILKRAIQRKYDSLMCSGQNDCDKTKKFVKEYLDKIFLIGLKLGALTPEEMDEFFLELTKEDREKSNHSADGHPFDNEDIIEEEEDISEENDDFNLSEADSSQESKRAVNNTAQTTSENNSVESLSNKLSVEEIDIFRKILTSYEDMTPRQIRIHYYQYLFAKNLLIRQYTKASKDNIWVNSEYTSCLIKLIFEINNRQEEDILSNEKIKYKGWADVSERSFLNDIDISLDNYKKLINVLEIVIGY